MKKTHYLKWLCLIICAVFAMQANAQNWVTLYETNFQGWEESTNNSRVWVNMDNGERAWKRNIGVQPNREPGTNINNTTDINPADIRGAIVRGGGTNYLQLPAMEFNNQVRVTIYAYTASSDRRWSIYANQFGMGSGEDDGDNDIDPSGIVLLDGVIITRYEMTKFTNTVNLNGSYNINLHSPGGSEGYLCYLKIETEQKGPSVDLATGSATKDPTIMETEGFETITFELGGSATNA
ncbi:MAG: hypothetical protein LBR75_05015, partial [Prevotellaceae bacterium]|nr:hypothetical protein [Prevotellaceae bacterium]